MGRQRAAGASGLRGHPFSARAAGGGEENDVSWGACWQDHSQALLGGFRNRKRAHSIKPRGRRSKANLRTLEGAASFHKRERNRTRSLSGGALHRAGRVTLELASCAEHDDQRGALRLGMRAGLKKCPSNQRLTWQKRRSQDQAWKPLGTFLGAGDGPTTVANRVTWTKKKRKGTDEYRKGGLRTQGNSKRNLLRKAWRPAFRERRNCYYPNGSLPRFAGRTSVEPGENWVRLSEKKQRLAEFPGSLLLIPARAYFFMPGGLKKKKPRTPRTRTSWGRIGTAPLQHFSRKGDSGGEGEKGGACRIE